MLLTQMLLRLGHCLPLVALLGLGVPVATQAAAARPDLSGFWVLKSDPGAVPAAPSKPAAAQTARSLLAAKGLDAPDGSPEYARNWCTAEGMPWQMTHAEPIDIRQGPLTVSMTFSGIWDSRNIYIDGQPHPDLDDFDFTTVGHSIGKWEGDTLVADTVGFEGGVQVIPGGGLRTQKTRLVERYRLRGPDVLEVTFTWTDPDTLLKPHTYTWRFERAQGTVWMTETACDPVRNMRTKGLPLPFDAPQ